MALRTFATSVESCVNFITSSLSLVVRILHGHFMRLLIRAHTHDHIWVMIHLIHEIGREYHVSEVVGRTEDRHLHMLVVELVAHHLLVMHQHRTVLVVVVLHGLRIVVSVFVHACLR